MVVIDLYEQAKLKGQKLNLASLLAKPEFKQQHLAPIRALDEDEQCKLLQRVIDRELSLAELKSRELVVGVHCTSEMGFRCCKHASNREQPHIIEQRHVYLRANRASKHPLPTIFLDETWYDSRHGCTHMWVDSDGNGGFKHAVGKGPRLIILHTNGEAGWTSKTD